MDGLDIIIQARLDEASSAKTINLQLSQLKVDPIRLKTSVDVKPLKQTVREINETKIELGSKTVHTNIDRLINRLELFQKKYSKFTNNKDFAKSWSELYAKAQVIDSREELRSLTSEVSLFEKQVEKAGLKSKSWFEELSSNAFKFQSWYYIGNAVAFITQSFTSAISTLKEVDTLLTEISKTSDRTNTELKELGVNAFDAANKYGASVQGYLTGVQEMSRAGKENSEELAELSILAQSAGDLSADLANQYLLATDAAYHYSGDVRSLTEVLDGQNQVTNRNAVSMEQLAEATKVSGAQAAQSQVPVEKLTAAVGTMNVVTQQGGDIAGRAFKSILMNLQQVKGETEDGEIIDEESLSKSEKACLDLGVSLKEVKNGITSLRDPMVILEELSEAYNSLDPTDARRANLIEAVGGKYRGNQLAALLSNWDTYEKLLSDYSNSAGSAMEEALKTADSWEGRLNRLENTWVAFIQNFADSELFKGVISGGEAFISLLDDITTSLGAIPSVAAAASAVLSTMGHGLISVHDNNSLGFSQRSFSEWAQDISEAVSSSEGVFEKLKNGISSAFVVPTEGTVFQLLEGSDLDAQFAKFNSATKNGTKNVSKFMDNCKDESFKAYLESVDNGCYTVQGYTKFIKASNAAMQGVSLSSKVAAVGVKAFGVALNTAIGFGIGLIIGSIIEFFQNLANAQQEAIDKANELVDAYDEAVESGNNSISKLNSMREEFDKLSEGVDKNGKNVKLTADEYDRYKELLDEITEISPDVIKGYDDQGNKILDYKNALDEAITSQEKFLENERNTYISKGEDIFGGKTNDYKNVLEEFRTISSDTLRQILGTGSDWEKLDRRMWESLGRPLNSEWIEERADILKNILDNMNIDWDWSATMENGWYENTEALREVYERQDEFLAQVKAAKWESNGEMVSFFSDEEIQKIDMALKSMSGSYTKLKVIEQDQVNYLAEWSKDQDWYKNIPTDAITSFTNGLMSVNDPLKTYNENLQAASAYGEAFVSGINGESGRSLLEMAQGLKNGSVSIQDYRDALDSFIGSWTGDQNALQSVISYFEELTNITGNAVGEISYNLNDVSAILNSFNTEIETISGHYDNLNKAVEEFNEYGAISASTFKSLSENNLLQYLQFTSEGLSLNTTALEENQTSLLSKAESDLKAALCADLLTLATQGVTDAELEAAPNAETAGTAVSTMGQNFANSVSGVLTAASALEAFNQAARGEDIGEYDFSGKEKQVQKLVDTYNNAITSIESISIRGFNNASNATDKAKKSADNYTKSLENAKSALQDLLNSAKDDQSAINTLLDLVKKMLQQKYNDEKDGIQQVKEDLEKQHEIDQENLEKELEQIEDKNEASKKALEEEYELRKENYDLQKKAIEEEQEAINKKIDAQRKALQEEKDEHDYQTELNERNKEISDLEAQLLAFVDPTDAAGQRKKLELEEELAKKRAELEEFQYEHSIDLQEKELDNQQDKYDEYYDDKLDRLDEEWDKYEEIYDNKIEALEKEMDTAKKAHDTKMDQLNSEYNRQVELLDQQIERIEEYLSKEMYIRDEAMQLINSKSKQLYDSLIEYNRIYGDGVNQTIKTAWDNAYEALSHYNSGSIDVLSTLNRIAAQTVDLQKEIDELAPKIDAAKQAADGLSSSFSSANRNLGSLKGTLNSVNSEFASMNKEQLSAMYISMSETRRMAAQYGRPSDVADLDRQLAEIAALMARYKKGTLSAKGGVSIIDEEGEELIIPPPENGRYKYLEKGTGVVPADETENLMKFGRDPKRFLRDKFGLFAKFNVDPSDFQQALNTYSPPGRSSHLGDVNTTISQRPVSIYYELNIQGATDKEIVRKVRNVIDDSMSDIQSACAQHTLTVMDRGRRHRGVKTDFYQM